MTQNGQVSAIESEQGKDMTVMKNFGKLPVGAQRVAIAVVLVVVLAAVVMLKQMVRTEEVTEHSEPA